MRIKVLIKTDTDQRTEVVEQAHCVIGRQDCDLVIDDKHCSRNHAIIYEGRNGQLRVKDLGSSNGTMLKAKKILDELISVGDEIQIGSTTLKILSYDPSNGLDEGEGDSVTYAGQ